MSLQWNSIDLNGRAGNEIGHEGEDPRLPSSFLDREVPNPQQNKRKNREGKGGNAIRTWRKGWVLKKDILSSPSDHDVKRKGV